MEKFFTRALTNDLENKIKIDKTYQQMSKKSGLKGCNIIALWSRSWALPLSVLDQLNASPGFQVLIFCTNVLRTSLRLFIQTKN